MTQITGVALGAANIPASPGTTSSASSNNLPAYAGPGAVASVAGTYIGTYGVIMNDTTNPTLFVALGGVDTWDSATSWTHITDVMRYVPLGRTKPISSYRRVDYWTHTGRTYWIPISDVDASGTIILGVDQVSVLQAFEKSHNPLLYREITGITRTVILENLTAYLSDGGAFWVVKFDIIEVEPLNTTNLGLVSTG